MERLPDGTTEWKRSPGGLVTALEPLLRRGAGAWIGWPGIPDSDEDPIVEDDLQLYPVRLSADDVAQYYEGFSNATLWPLYHDVIVKPIYHREWWDRYVDVNRRFAEATVARRGARRDGVDPGLPAAAGAEDAADAAARPHHRVLPAHSVPAGGAVHADAVADRDRRRPARRRPRRLPPSRRRAELPDPVSAPRRCEHLTRDGRRALPLRRGAGRLPHGEGRRLPDLHRLGRRSTARPATEASDSGPGRSAASSATRARSCWASTGWTTPRASTFGCGRFRSCSPSIGPNATTPCWCSWPRRAANASRATR